MSRSTASRATWSCRASAAATARTPSPARDGAVGSAHAPGVALLREVEVREHLDGADAVDRADALVHELEQRLVAGADDLREHIEATARDHDVVGFVDR